MRFLFYRYGSICEPDMIEALKELGHEINSIELEITDKSTTPQQTLHTVTEALFSKEYHGVISINYYPILSAICNIFRIRYISWTVDSPVMELYSHTLSNEWNRTFFFDRLQYENFSEKNPGRIFHLPLAVNARRLDTLFTDVNNEDPSRFHSEISFVGSLYTEKCLYDKVQGLTPRTEGYLNAIMEAQSLIYGYYFIPEILQEQTDIIEEFKAHMPEYYTPPEDFTRDDVMTMSMVYLAPKITTIERLRLMRTLGQYYPVNLYTGSDTTGLPIRNCGRAKSLTEMPLIFRNSRINLNTTAKGIRSGLPLRIFDVLGCGGFLLTNYQPELSEHFIAGEDLDVYTCDEELLEKTAYYLSHEKERQEIAHNGLEKVRASHTYTIRLAQMLSLAFSV
ncbi:MAG: DUF3880 domain-containing protein [Roseburia sp.]